MQWKFGLFIAALIHVAGSAPVVQLQDTTVVGTPVSGLAQEFFGGIPFAEPPLGNLRFSPPVARPNPGVKIFNATQFGAACGQISGSVSSGANLSGFATQNQSEDCLTINVLRPAGLNSNSKLPIMAWVYGGGFLTGASSQFDGGAIVSQSVTRGTPIIYVNMNYRLGPLGFPVGNEAARKGSLNLGQKDVMTALEWIQENIQAFGGDPKKVTLFGESAGAIILAQLFLNPRLGDVARAAIFESGSAATTALFNASRGESDWQNFASAIPECAGVTVDNQFGCLRSASFDEIIRAASIARGKSQAEFPFVPVIDGPGGVIPDLPTKLFAKGRFARLPFISGTNLDEGTLFTPTTINTTEDLSNFIAVASSPSEVGAAKLVQVIGQFLELYPDVPALGSPFNTGNNTFGLSSQFKRAAALDGDIAFQSQRRAWTQVASKVGVKVFAYLFTDPQPFNTPSLGVSHGSEVLYVYGATTNGAAATALSHNIIDYWVSFATSLDPNDRHGNLARAHWTQFTPNSEVVIQLNGNNLTIIPDNYRRKQIAFINANPIAVDD